MATTKIQATKNYALFNRIEGENRPLEPDKRRRLRDSMKRYGFLKCFPIVCYRDKDGKLVVKDGQHRLTIAQELGLTIWWVEETTDFDVAITNSAQKGWAPRDYAMKWAASGHVAYQDIIDFAERFSIGMSTSAALLGGTIFFSNISHAFYQGTFKVKDRAWAESVGGLYMQMCAIGPALKNNHFLAACMAVCRVPDFEPKRLISGAERLREKLVAYYNRESYLDVLETLYNHNRNRGNLRPLKLPALAVMRERRDVAQGRKKNGKSKGDESAAA